ncbi:hypothetical protein BKA62DRAFT_730892 [Auriculariales sp. MPI-PUGE-AT-0066]|nr:hypothetical protein BKA62DRAFT_730892 [Auriculariales sp. MPI-PUGE-AT-0066]
MPAREESQMCLSPSLSSTSLPSSTSPPAPSLPSPLHMQHQHPQRARCALQACRKMQRLSRGGRRFPQQHNPHSSPAPPPQPALLRARPHGIGLSPRAGLSRRNRSSLRSTPALRIFAPTPRFRAHTQQPPPLLPRASSLRAFSHIAQSLLWVQLARPLLGYILLATCPSKSTARVGRPSVGASPPSPTPAQLPRPSSTLGRAAMSRGLCSLGQDLGDEGCMSPGSEDESSTADTSYIDTPSMSSEVGHISGSAMHVHAPVAAVVATRSEHATSSPKYAQPAPSPAQSVPFSALVVASLPVSSPGLESLGSHTASSAPSGIEMYYQNGNLY